MEIIELFLRLVITIVGVFVGNFICRLIYYAFATIGFILLCFSVKANRFLCVCVKLA